MPNIEQIATGSFGSYKYKRGIELWELRTESKENQDDSKKQKTKGKDHKGKRDNDDIPDDTKEPTKRLVGHKKAIREIAYSINYKILVSVGFDFQIFVWNPYWEKEIIKLDMHESPLVGVNIP